MYEFDPATKGFLENGGLAAQVGSADPNGRPQIAAAWGPRENGDGTMTVFLDTARAARTLANLAMNRNIALIVADPISYRSVQFKGEWLSTAAPTEEEQAWVQRHREGFASNLALVGDSPGAIRNMWMDEITRIDFTVRAAFDQTPGPQAGQPL